MWFKNLAVYRFTEPFELKAEELEQKLQQQPFRACGSHDEFSFGWTPPLGRAADALVHANNGFFMLCGKKEEKVVPGSVVNEMLQERISEIEEREARKLPAKERNRLKDELIFELLPRAFSFSKKTYAYIDSQGGWLVVDAASAKKAEDLLSQLRKCLGSLPVVPMTATAKPAGVMTQWLTDNASPKDILIEDECELRSPEEEGAIIRCKRHDLALPEIKNHLDSGKQVIKLAMSWAERLSFVLDENLAVKRLKFLDLIQDQAADIEAFDETEQFDADFSIMTAELAQFLPRLLELFNAEGAI
ncbi:MULTISPECIES: recombination-associated protein RdgC [Methylomonas]|uniref:Recombination-associated protein RdgC n=1 Tax=Methylomonas koyamae TaxID=702114 RepID=A0A291IQ82_9GAMM|nr:MULTISPECIES: recombination-associated protein RdgC [Methylomonas]ANE57402.1 recombination-associated protein RdgC [Methylomonas sp. DH-1]ATG92384.1 recombination-associated protein RdgC [Methylomonas koyamae]OAI26099.1 recombination-associated protein RdgC [Methylomonas koyamae]BBL60644.1 recombination-associated protein RdgC [Methylomonas koyamae]